MPEKKQTMWFDKEKSLTKLMVEYFHKTPGRNSNKATYYSFINLDNKSKQRGIDQLRKYALSLPSGKINYAAIYDNISGNLIENVIIHGKIV